jgi:hypothetical protein
MAVYKVIQDIEAEDKLVGFLTLKTFIYALIAAALAYINVRLLIASEIGPLRFIFILILAMPMLIFGILAAPLGRDQPTEVWILSHIKFYLNPRKRVWDQSGAQELVTITVPKKFERDYTKGLSQRDVRSRLKALATTLDSRGWAVKNVAVDLSANPSYLDVEPVDSDRLVSASSVVQTQQVDVHAADDIMDENNNPTAQHFDSLMKQATKERRQKVSEKLNKALQDVEKTPKLEDSTFLDEVAQEKKGETKFVGHKIITPGSNHEEAETQTTAAMGESEKSFLGRLHDKSEEVHTKSADFKAKTHKHRSKSDNKNAHKAVNAPTTPAVTAAPENVKLKELIEVAKHDKLSTLAKEASRGDYKVKQIAPNELEIDLHERG